MQLIKCGVIHQIWLFENSADRSQYKFQGKLALFMWFGTFLCRKQNKIGWNVCFTFTLLIQI